jgi:hypothetical protein
MEPDRLRPPEGEGPTLDPSQSVPAYTPPPQGSSQPQIDTSFVVEPVQAAILPAPLVSELSAPIIGALEKGMYYVQVAAYRNKESVEYEITRRIDKDHPVAVEINSESGENPVYRILIGPVDYEQSRIILARYDGMFPGAFVRLGR